MTELNELETAAKLHKEQEIYNNFTTPLIGQFLNLPREPVLIQCPSCNTKQLSHVESSSKWWAFELNRVVNCLYISLCCCCCINYQRLFRQSDRNHYCKNCGCFFGRSMKHKQIRVSQK